MILYYRVSEKIYKSGMYCRFEMSTEHMKLIEVSQDTYELLTEVEKYKENMDEIIHRIALRVGQSHRIILGR